MRSVVPPGGALSKTPQEVSQCLIAEKIQAFLGNFKPDTSRERFRQFAPPVSVSLLLVERNLLFMKRQITFFDEALDQLIEQVLKQRSLKLAFILRQHLLDLSFIDQSLLHQSLEQSTPQSVERRICLLPLPGPVVVIILARIE